MSDAKNLWESNKKHLWARMQLCTQKRLHAQLRHVTISTNQRRLSRALPFCFPQRREILHRRSLGLEKLVCFCYLRVSSVKHYILWNCIKNCIFRWRVCVGGNSNKKVPFLDGIWCHRSWSKTMVWKSFIICTPDPHITIILVPSDAELLGKYI